jgi:hypothetical protein
VFYNVVRSDIVVIQMSPVVLCKNVAKHLKMCLGLQVDVTPSIDVLQLSPNNGNRGFPKRCILVNFLDHTDSMLSCTMC